MLELLSRRCLFVTDNTIAPHLLNSLPLLLASPRLWKTIGDVFAWFSKIFWAGWFNSILTKWTILNDSWRIMLALEGVAIEPQDAEMRSHTTYLSFYYPCAESNQRMFRDDIKGELSHCFYVEHLCPRGLFFAVCDNHASEEIDRIVLRISNSIATSYPCIISNLLW